MYFKGINYQFVHLSGFCLDEIFCMAIPLATKLCIVVHFLEPECPKKRLECYFQGQGYSEGQLLKKKKKKKECLLHILRPIELVATELCVVIL